MIDYLIYDKKFTLKRCILKVMNFQICRDFSQNFLNFYQFILTYNIMALANEAIYAVVENT